MAFSATLPVPSARSVISGFWLMKVTVPLLLNTPAVLVFNATVMLELLLAPAAMLVAVPLAVKGAGPPLKLARRVSVSVPLAVLAAATFSGVTTVPTRTAPKSAASVFSCATAGA